MRTVLQTLAVLALLLTTAGCQTLRRGGAPEPAFDTQADLQALSNEFKTATNIQNYYAIVDPDQKVPARNRFVTGRIVQIDLRYIQFIRSLTTDRQKIDAASDLTQLTLNLAGTLAGGARAKTNLAAAAAGIGGAKQTIDKDFYYQESIDALVGTMNARRKEVLIGILRGLATKSIDQYPFELALTQLQEYEAAGSINGALRFINTQSADQEKRNDAKLNQLTESSEAAITLAGELIDAIKVGTESSINNALTALGEDKSKLALKLDDKKLILKKKLNDISASKQTAQEQEKELEGLAAKFKKAGLMQ